LGECMHLPDGRQDETVGIRTRQIATRHVTI
jgi:hypothetical protein